ncbi:hypothetical protein VKT23_010303 [Stygiomarasmius scandens]|uniref:Cytochrome P450 n=1 Tax=Marasmiellus scandens TaxID=2682957 RepID=A0ABR1JDU7_9AGAR
MGGDWLLPFMKYNERFKGAASFCELSGFSWNNTVTRKIFHQLTNTKQIVRPNQLQAVRRLLRRLLDGTPEYDKHFRLMTGDFILSSSYGIIPESAEEPYIKRSNNLVILVSESNQRDQYIGSYKATFSDTYHKLTRIPCKADVFPWLKHLPTWFPGITFKKTALEARQDFADARELPFQHVQDQMAKGTAKPSLAAHFIDAIQSGSESSEVKNQKMEELAASLGNVYLGAADTTNAAIWSYVLIIALHPEVQRKGQAILDNELNGRLPTFKDYGTIPYIDAIVNEIFRYSPITPLGVPHVTRTDDVYQGRFIPKGTMVFGNLWALLRDETIYGSNVEEFDPERFLDCEGKVNTTKEFYLYDTAFGWGRRICPGKDLAREMLWLTAASLLATFDIVDPTDADGRPVDPVCINDKYSQRPVSMPPYFAVTFKPRSAIAESLIREDMEEF